MVHNQSDTFEIGGEETVHRLGYGAMRITGDGIIGEPEDPEYARKVLRAAVEMGVDFIDTADSYGPGTSERLIREALLSDPEYREEILVATKGGLLRQPSTEWLPRGDPEYLRNALLCSLDRLGVEQIDLYQHHRPDPDTPFEDSITTIAELQDEGYIKHVGVSNVTVEQLDRARDIVDIATVQNEYNVVNRADEDVLQACENYDIGFIPWYPLAAGDLGEKAETIESVADEQDASRYQIALAWLLDHSDVTLPIPGTSSIEHLEANVAASGIELTDEQYARLTE